MGDRADMSDDLIERLRNPGLTIVSASENVRARRQAADRIEALEAENGRLREAAEGMLRFISFGTAEFGAHTAELVASVDGLHWSAAAWNLRRAALNQEKDDG